MSENEPEAPEPAPGGEVGPAPALPVKPIEMPMPLVVVSGIAGALFILLPLFVRKGPNKGITRCCIMLTVFSMWIFWATVYIAQMRPLLGPRMHNTSLAWIKYAWMGQGFNESDDANATETVPGLTDNTETTTTTTTTEEP